MKPDFYFVLPWHFKKEILVREQKIRKRGTKFIFPLPKIQNNLVIKKDIIIIPTYKEELNVKIFTKE